MVGVLRSHGSPAFLKCGVEHHGGARRAGRSGGGPCMRRACRWLVQSKATFSAVLLPT